MITRLGIVALVVAVLALAGEPVQADKKTSPRDTLSFGLLKTPSTEMARLQALEWLKSTGKSDEATVKAFESVWSQNDRPLLDRVADSLALGDPDAARLMSEARNSTAAAPLELAAILKDAKRPIFFRANLTVAYARELCKRRVYEEALQALRLVKAEQVIDPATYLFQKAVAEHALLHKDDASRSINRLLDDAADSPERYKMVATLMHLDMQTWKTKDLGEIARKMDNIERRLELARGGPQTQKLQREVVMRLDELIKKMENLQKGSSQPNDGSCPNGGQPKPGQQNGSQPNQPNQPQRDSFGGNDTGPGNVDKKKLDGWAKEWGKLPPKEQTKAMQEMTRDLPAEYRELIETYFRKLAQEQGRP